MAVYLLPGANQLQAAETIYETMATAKGLFPPDLDYKIVYDTTPAVQASIESIVHTFVEALILVTLVVFIFLQNLRATIIPLLTVPGLDHRHLHLLPDAGLLGQHAVDVRPRARHRHRGGRRHRRRRGRHAPHRARHGPARGDRAGDEGGVGAGHRHRAHPLGRVHPRRLPGRPHRADVPAVRAHHRHLGAALGLQRALAVARALRHAPQAAPAPRGARSACSSADSTGCSTARPNGYVGVARLLVRRACSRSCSWGSWWSGSACSARALPAGFIPEEDQGLFGVNVQLPPAASLERTSAVLRKVEEIVAKLDGIESYQTIGGYGVVTSTYQPNFGTIFVRLKPWEERHGEALHVNGHHGRAAAGARQDPRGDRLSVQHPHHLRLRRLGGLQLPPPGPERHARAWTSSAPRRAPSWRRRASGPSSPPSSPRSTPPIPR